MNKESLRLAQKALLDGGIKVFQKDMKYVTIIPEVIIGNVAHKRYYIITMKDETTYKVVQQTVDKENKYSIHSGRYITVNIKKYTL